MLYSPFYVIARFDNHLISGVLKWEQNNHAAINLRNAEHCHCMSHCPCFCTLTTDCLCVYPTTQHNCYLIILFISNNYIGFLAVLIRFSYLPTCLDVTLRESISHFFIFKEMSDISVTLRNWKISI